MTLSLYITSKDQLKKVTILKNSLQILIPGLQHLAENIFGNLNYQNLSTHQQINGAGISAGAANICINARARTTPARVCSAPPRSAALGWSLSNTQFFFHKTVVKMFPHNRKPNNQDIILIYGMFYWSQYCMDYDNFSKVKCCYFLVTFLRKRPKIHKNGNDIGLSLLCECDIEIIAAQVLQYRESSHKTSSHKTNFSIRRFWLI